MEGIAVFSKFKAQYNENGDDSWWYPRDSINTYNFDGLLRKNLNV